MPNDIIRQTIYVVTSKTGNETYLIEAYTSESDAIEHVRKAIEWYTQWISKPSNALATKYDIWPEKANPWDNVTPDIIDNSIIYDWQRVNLNK